MADYSTNSNDTNDGWSEIVAAHLENCKIQALISVRTVKLSAGLKEHHVKLCSEEDDCCLYGTVINLEEYRRLAATNNFIASFDNLPHYLRQLLRAARQENEYGQSYFINLLSPATLGVASRIELLITTRQAGHVIQNRVLCVPLMAASDAEFKDHLTSRFEELKKEKEQLRRSASFLESQLRSERARNRELEDKNHWFRKELKFTQNLLKSAENIQKHYEVLLSLRHRGETGSTIVTIGDSSRLVYPEGTLPLEDPMCVDSSASRAVSSSTLAATASNASLSPPIHKASSCFSQASEDDECHAKATKRKVSFYATADNGSDSDNDHIFRESTSSSERKHPPPRKYAAAIPLFDHQLVKIRREEEERRSSVRTSEEDGSGQKTDDDEDDGWSTSSRRKKSSGDVCTPLQEQKSPLLPSPLLSRPMSPPAVVSQNQGDDDATVQQACSATGHDAVKTVGTGFPAGQPKVMEIPSERT